MKSIKVLVANTLLFLFHSLAFGTQMCNTVLLQPEWTSFVETDAVRELKHQASLKYSSGNLEESLEIIHSILDKDNDLTVSVAERRDLISLKSSIYLEMAVRSGEEDLYNQALNELKFLLRAKPYDYDLHIRVLNVHLSAENFEDALTSYDVAMRLAIDYKMQNDLKKHLRGKYKLLKDLGMRERLKPLLKFALLKNPDSLWAYTRITNLYLEDKDFETALTFANNWVDSETASNATAHLMKIDALIGLNRYEEAKDISLQGMQTFPDFFDRFQTRLLSI